jgi:hypothetical protein
MQVRTKRHLDNRGSVSFTVLLSFDELLHLDREVSRAS